MRSSGPAVVKNLWSTEVILSVIIEGTVVPVRIAPRGFVELVEVDDAVNLRYLVDRRRVIVLKVESVASSAAE